MISGDELDQMAFSFFKLFAHYESELKQQGYFQVNNGGKIIVDWDKFVNEQIGKDFLKRLGQDHNAALYILSHPPKKQVVDSHGDIVWAEVPNNECSVQTLFGHISRIRNNLYHGAKFNGTWFDPERSNQLLKCALVVLEAFKKDAGVH